MKATKQATLEMGEFSKKAIFVPKCKRFFPRVKEMIVFHIYTDFVMNIISYVQVRWDFV